MSGRRVCACRLRCRGRDRSRAHSTSRSTWRSGSPAATSSGCRRRHPRRRMRIRGALENSGFSLPPRRITVNLAPADLRKDGAAFDVPIAVGMLCAARHGPAEALADTLFVGELALDGTLRPVRGVLPIAAWARARAVRRLIVPPENAGEAAVVGGCVVRRRAIWASWSRVLRGEATAADGAAAHAVGRRVRADRRTPDLADVRGQEFAAARAGDRGGGRAQPAVRRPARLGQDDAGPAAARDPAAAVVRRGAGDRRWSIRLPGCSAAAALLRRRGRFARRTTRSQRAGLVGGGPRRGRARSRSRTTACCSSTSCSSSRARCSRRCASRSRTGRVTIVRARRAVTFPADFMLVAAMNPCPCGHRGSTVRTCTCSRRRSRRYRSRAVGSAARPHRPARRRAGAAVPGAGARRARRAVGAGARAGWSAARERQRARGPDARTRACTGGASWPRRRRSTPRGHALLERAVARLGLSARGPSPASAAWPAPSPISTGAPTVRAPAPRRGACSTACSTEACT